MIQLAKEIDENRFDKMYNYKIVNKLLKHPKISSKMIEVYNYHQLDFNSLIKDGLV